MPSNPHRSRIFPGRTRATPAASSSRRGLKALLTGMQRVAMEYSPGCAIPYIARVDAGTIELVRAIGRRRASRRAISSSGSPPSGTTRPIATHVDASEKLYRVKDRAFEAIAAPHCTTGVPTTEFEIQQLMAGWFRDEGLVSDSDPNVSAAENAGNPHYLPTARRHARDRRRTNWSCSISGASSIVRARYLPTSPGWATPVARCRSGSRGRSPPSATRATRRSRSCRSAARTGRRPSAASRWTGPPLDVLKAAGYGDDILHRTGHSLGESVHGNGVNMDDYETHDDRRLLPGTGFTIEPGVYFSDFGVRTEINMVMGAHDATVTGPLQTEILALVQ